MGNSVSPQFDNARKTGVCSLSGMKLKELPPQFGNLSTNLRTADLSKNKLTLLPYYIGRFSSLKNLNVSDNRLETLPEEMQELAKLEILTADNNRISRIPTSIFPKLWNLKTVSLSNNKLKIFPVELCQLPKLDAADLSYNQIEEITDSLQRFKAIELNLNNNRLRALPRTLVDCERLKVLRIQENCLPLEAIREELLKESRISLLACDGNLFEMKMLHDKDGYEEYMSRYSETKKKFVK